LMPALKSSVVIGCRAGVRASTPDHRPIVKQVDERIWIFTGLGSKGLLYHALFAEQLVKAII
jgi:glycine/D-amino acid oxidase-like deaminating enzyme